MQLPLLCWFMRSMSLWCSIAAQTMARVAASQEGSKRPRPQAGFDVLGCGKAQSPTTLEEVLQWPKYVLDRMEHAGLGVRLREVCSSGIYLSTHYSGMGGAELALRMLMDELRARGCRAWMHAQHAGDISRFCRAVLLRHPGVGCGPRHVFGDLTEALPRSTVAALRAIQCEAKLTLDGLFQQGATAKDAKTAKEQIGREAMQKFHSILSGDSVLRHLRTTTAYCYKCKGNCHRQDVHLISAIRQVGGMVVEISGSTCVDFSAMNQNKPGLSGDSNLVFAAWAAGVLALGPDLIIHECVRAFPSWLLELWFGHCYDICSLVLTPLLLGYPTNRPRRISICLRKDCTPLRIPYTLGKGGFGELMARRAQTTNIPRDSGREQVLVFSSGL